jgi:bacteriorhodopsin
MASNLGNTAISTTMRDRTTRAIWYARYVDWSITVPLLLLTLLLATGLPLGDIVTVVFCTSPFLHSSYLRC